MRRRGAASVSASLVLLALLTPVTHAQEATRARLATRPTFEQLVDAYPVSPLVNAISGRAVLLCDVDAQGASACTASEETPAGQGFGAAATQLAANWRFEPATQDGAPIASQVTVPITFANVFERPLMIMSIHVSSEPNFDDRYPWRRDYYPERALAEQVQGVALVACTTREGSELECLIEREFPEGYDFGARAVALIREQSEERVRQSASFRVRVAFAGISYPMWAERPTGPDFARRYPHGAVALNLSGRSIPICEIQADRTVVCVPGVEEPEGFGFAAAAAELANLMVLTESAIGQPGLSVGDRIEVPITFSLR